MIYYVYALKSLKHNYIYVGLTNNLERRIKQHNQGKERTTRAYKPFKVIKTYSFGSRQEARNFEKYLKSTTGKRELRGRSGGMADASDSKSDVLYGCGGSTPPSGITK